MKLPTYVIIASGSIKTVDLTIVCPYDDLPGTEDFTYRIAQDMFPSGYRKFGIYKISDGADVFVASYRAEESKPYVYLSEGIKA